MDGRSSKEGLTITMQLSITHSRLNLLPTMRKSGRFVTPNDFRRKQLRPPTPLDPLHRRYGPGRPIVVPEPGLILKIQRLRHEARTKAPRSVLNRTKRRTGDQVKKAATGNYLAHAGGGGMKMIRPAPSPRSALERTTYVKYTSGSSHEGDG